MAQSQIKLIVNFNIQIGCSCVDYAFEHVLDCTSLQEAENTINNKKAFMYLQNDDAFKTWNHRFQGLGQEPLKISIEDMYLIKTTVRSLKYDKSTITI